MKNSLYALLCIIPFAASAAPPSESALANQYFSKSDPKLSANEIRGLAMAKRWDNSGSMAVKPFQENDGVIRFVHGAQQASIVCAVLQVCDIELQEGEQINNINMGDTVRWAIEPAVTGSGASEVQHLIVKPFDVGLETSLVVTTDRRTYHMKLRSTRSRYMQRVGFTYPGDSPKKWQVFERRTAQQTQANASVATVNQIGELDFKYNIDGSARWRPLRVYNDGRRTIIQFPENINQTEAPTLLAIRPDDNETVMVNYRMLDDKFVVDNLFDKAILITGVGRSQSKVTITRGG